MPSKCVNFEENFSPPKQNTYPPLADILLTPVRHPTTSFSDEAPPSQNSQIKADPALALDEDTKISKTYTSGISRRKGESAKIHGFCSVFGEQSVSPLKCTLTFDSRPQRPQKAANEWQKFAWLLTNCRRICNPKICPPRQGTITKITPLELLFQS